MSKVVPVKFVYASDLGDCCICRLSDNQVRNILLLNQRSPEPGTGWGCLQCGLPEDGAVAVLCDPCLDLFVQDNATLKFVCVGKPDENRRLSIDQLSSDKFDHDLTKHPEVTRDDLAH